MPQMRADPDPKRLPLLAMKAEAVDKCEETYFFPDLTKPTSHDIGDTSSERITAKLIGAVRLNPADLVNVMGGYFVDAS